MKDHHVVESSDHRKKDVLPFDTGNHHHCTILPLLENRRLRDNRHHHVKRHEMGGLYSRRVHFRKATNMGVVSNAHVR